MAHGDFGHAGHGGGHGGGDCCSAMTSSIDGVVDAHGDIELNGRNEVAIARQAGATVVLADDLGNGESVIVHNASTGNITLETPDGLEQLPAQLRTLAPDAAVKLLFVASEDDCATRCGHYVCVGCP